MKKTDPNKILFGELFNFDNYGDNEWTEVGNTRGFL